MNNEERDRLLRLSFFSGAIPEPNTIVDERSFQETGDRLRRKFIAAIFEQRHPTPVKDFAIKIPFGIWISREREATNLEIRELANALEITPERLTNVEKCSVKPWELNAGFSIGLMHLMRLHFDGLASLIRNSAAASQMLGINSAQARCHGGQMNSSRGDAVSKALELFKANNADPVRDQQAEDWLNSVRTQLLAANDYLIH